MALAEDYYDLIRKQCAGMVAIYPPNYHVALGDYGPMVDGRFVRQGHVNDFQPDLIRPHIAGEKMSREFTSKKTTRKSFGAKAELKDGIITARPGLELEFKNDFSVYFALAGCTVRTVADMNGLSAFIVGQYRNHLWDKDWIVITTIIEASNMTVVISQSENSKLVLEATADVAQIDMASVNLSLGVTYDSSASEKWLTEKPSSDDKPLTPFVWGHRIKTNIFGGGPKLESKAIPKSLDFQPPPTEVRLEPSFGGGLDLSLWSQR